MNKRAITKTAVCYWSADDDCYVVRSPLSDRVIGIGNTQGEAWELFIKHLDSVYMAYLEGRLAAYEKPGRPRKGLVAFNVSLQPQTKERLVQLALEFSSTQGEVVDFLAFFHDVMKTQDLVQKSPAEPFELAHADSAADSSPTRGAKQKTHSHISREHCNVCAETTVTPAMIRRAASAQKEARRKTR